MLPCGILRLFSSFSVAKRKAKPATFALELENLEPRRLFAVTVSEGYPGFYLVESDAESDNIQISVNQHDHTFTLDGNTYADVGYIQVMGNGGDDIISVTSVDGSGDIGAVIAGGDGNDNLTLNFDGGIWGGEGDDVLNLSDSFYGVADGQGGNDVISVTGVCVSADIQGGDGNDLIDCSGSGVGVTVHGGAGNDSILGSMFDDAIYGDGGSDYINSGGGNDVIYAQDGDQCTIVGGAGGDAAYLNGSEAIVRGVETIYY
jgi:Ca2+-binding RTX toxin-like protein